MSNDKKIKFLKVTSVMLAAASLSLAGCTSGDTQSSTSGADNPTVGATLLSLEYPFLVTLDEAMSAKASDAGINLVSLDPRQEVSTELTQIEDLITRKVDAIVMIPVDQKTSQEAAKKVNAAEIPLVLVNTRFTDDFAGEFVTYVGSDDTEAGEIQASYANEQLADGDQIIYMVTQYGGASTERRKSGFVDNLKDGITIATEIEALGSRAEAKTTMEDLLRRYSKEGEIKAVIAQNDEMAIGAASAIAEAGRTDEFTVIAGVDGSDAGLDAVEAGTISATVFQDAVGQGDAAMEAVSKVVSGESVEKEIIIPFQLVTSENLAEYK